MGLAETRSAVVFRPVTHGYTLGNHQKIPEPAPVLRQATRGAVIISVPWLDEMTALDN